MLQFITSGESHGKGLTVILDGIPAGLSVDEDAINHELWRRQQGYGRGGRMKIETDKIESMSGIRHGKTMGSPVTFFIENKDFKNWENVMCAAPVEEAGKPPVTSPRPGHADLVGLIKYQHEDIRDVIERASARETAARVAAGALCKIFLGEFGIEIFSWVLQIGAHRWKGVLSEKKLTMGKLRSLFEKTEKSPVRCPDETVSKKIVALIDETKKNGDTLGGVFEVAAANVPVGLGSYVQWNRKLDGKLAQAFLSIHAVKGFEIGMGFQMAEVPGSCVHDEIFYCKNGENAKGVNVPYYRKTNNAGGLEGGVTNGEPVIVRAVMKPISTLMKPLSSVNVRTKESVQSHIERSDVCAVPAAAVVGEAMMAVTLADAMLEKFGGDSVGEMKSNFSRYQDVVRKM